MDFTPRGPTGNALPNLEELPSLKELVSLRDTDQIFLDKLAEQLREAWHARAAVDPSLTQDQGATLLGIGKSAFNHILTGRSVLGLTHARKLAPFLGVDMQRLVCEMKADSPLAELQDRENARLRTFTSEEFRRVWELVSATMPEANVELRIDWTLEALNTLPIAASPRIEIEKAIRQAIVKSAEQSQKSAKT